MHSQIKLKSIPDCTLSSILRMLALCLPDRDWVSGMTQVLLSQNVWTIEKWMISEQSPQMSSGLTPHPRGHSSDHWDWWHPHGSPRSSLPFLSPIVTILSTIPLTPLMSSIYPATEVHFMFCDIAILAIATVLGKRSWIAGLLSKIRYKTKEI